MLFKQMAATIDIHNNLPDQNPQQDLKEQVASGEILKRMYHRQEVQFNQVTQEGAGLFW